MSQFKGPEYFVVRCLLFAANLTDVGIVRYVCLLFPDAKNITKIYKPKCRLTSSDTPESLQT